MTPQTISKFRYMVQGFSHQALHIIFDVILDEICRRGRKINRWAKPPLNPKPLPPTKED